MKRCVSEKQLLLRIEQGSESKRKEMIKARLLLPSPSQSRLEKQTHYLFKGRTGGDRQFTEAFVPYNGSTKRLTPIPRKKRTIQPTKKVRRVSRAIPAISVAPRTWIRN
jgi:hypothetical protein